MQPWIFEVCDSFVTQQLYEVGPRRRDKRGVDPISNVLPFGRLRYGEPNAVSIQSAVRSSITGHMVLPSFAFMMPPEA